MQSHLRNPNFAYLLIGLLAVLTINPITLDLFNYSSSLLTSLTFSSTMVIGIWSLHESRALFRLGLILIGISLAASGLSSIFPGWHLEIIDMTVVMIFCGMSFRFILEDITADLKVDINRVIGAACLYLLIGLIFGLLYTILETFVPGSFSNLPEQAERVSGELFYYSYVTLTTLGYGDIVPLRPIARTLAFLEAIVGVFYMSIMIGAMIGLLLNRANAETTEKNRFKQPDNK
jgi:voltage-gated potassium channel